MTLNVEMRIGDRVIIRRDPKGNVVEQPAVIVGLATRDEYLDFVMEHVNMSREELVERLDTNNCKYFCEVTTD